MTRQGRDKKTGKYVALKEIHIDRDEGTPSTALREITLMKSLRGHPNIVSLEDVLHTDESLTLVFELCKQDLKAFIDSFKPPGSARNTPVQINMPVDIIRDLTYQMLRGVGALHENRIIHRDLKVRLQYLPYLSVCVRVHVRLPSLECYHMS